MEDRRIAPSELCTEVALLRQTQEKFMELMEGAPGRPGFIPTVTEQIKDLQMWRDIHEDRAAQREKGKARSLAMYGAGIALLTATVHFLVDYLKVRP